MELDIARHLDDEQLSLLRSAISRSVANAQRDARSSSLAHVSCLVRWLSEQARLAQAEWTSEQVAQLLDALAADVEKMGRDATAPRP